MFGMNAADPDFTNPTGLSEREMLDNALCRLKGMVVEMKIGQLEELARMRAIGMDCARRLERRARGRLSPAEEAVFARRSRGIINDFVTVARAVRQIIVLEQELAGLRPARRDGRAQQSAQPAPPNMPVLPRPKAMPSALPGVLRDDLQEYYDHRPVGEAVSWIRSTLSIEPPADDPFGARPQREVSVAPEAEPPEAAGGVPLDAAPSVAAPRRLKATHPSGSDVCLDDPLPAASAAIGAGPERHPAARGPP